MHVCMCISMFAYICVVSICLCYVSANIPTYLILANYDSTLYITSKIALSWTVVFYHAYIWMFYCVLYVIWNTYCLMCFTGHVEYVLFCWSLHDMLNMYCLHAYFLSCFTYLCLVRNDPINMFKQTNIWTSTFVIDSALELSYGCFNTFIYQLYIQWK